MKRNTSWFHGPFLELEILETFTTGFFAENYHLNLKFLFLAPASKLLDIVRDRKNAEKRARKMKIENYKRREECIFPLI